MTKTVIRFCFVLDVHSEKVERRRSINEEREKSRIFDSIISEVTRDFEEEEMSKRYNDRPRKITKLAELSSITDPAYLCELLDNDKDPESIEVNRHPILQHKIALLNPFRPSEGVVQHTEVNGSRLQGETQLPAQRRNQYEGESKTSSCRKGLQKVCAVVDV